MNSGMFIEVNWFPTVLRTADQFTTNDSDARNC